MSNNKINERPYLFNQSSDARMHARARQDVLNSNLVVRAFGGVR